MSESKKYPYLVHGLRAEGFNIVEYNGGDNPVSGARPRPVAYGEELVVTQQLADANRDRNGVSWLEFTESEQLAAFRGRPKFGYGPTPPSVRDEIREHRLAEAKAEREKLLANSFTARKADSEARMLTLLNAEIASLDADQQAS